MVKTTRAQREALFRIFQRDFPGWITPFKREQDYLGRKQVVAVPSTQYRRFRAKLVPEFGGYGVVMLPWAGMWLGIERDGYTHS